MKLCQYIGIPECHCTKLQGVNVAGLALLHAPVLALGCLSTLFTDLE